HRFRGAKGVSRTVRPWTRSCVAKLSPPSSAAMKLGVTAGHPCIFPLSHFPLEREREERITVVMDLEAEGRSGPFHSSGPVQAADAGAIPWNPFMTDPLGWWTFPGWKENEN